jgi:hypothetical protein
MRGPGIRAAAIEGSGWGASPHRIKVSDLTTCAASGGSPQEVSASVGWRVSRVPSDETVARCQAMALSPVELDSLWLPAARLRSAGQGDETESIRKEVVTARDWYQSGICLNEVSRSITRSSQNGRCHSQARLHL